MFRQIKRIRKFLEINGINLYALLSFSHWIISSLIYLGGSELKMVGELSVIVYLILLFVKGFFMGANIRQAKSEGPKLYNDGDFVILFILYIIPEYAALLAYFVFHLSISVIIIAYVIILVLTLYLYVIGFNKKYED